MKGTLNLFCLGGFLALSLMPMQSAIANEENKRSQFQFTTAVQVPGRVLAPGKYVFALDDTSDLNVVRIFSEDSNGNESLVTTVATLPDLLSTIPDTPIVQFKSLKSGGPEAIDTWFSAGEDWGWRFIYPRR